MRQIDPKYSIQLVRSGEGVEHEESQIVNASGVPIPPEEPLMLFRARDRLALRMLRYYRQLAVEDGCTEFHLQGIDNRIAAFTDFVRKYPEKMKQPGITRGL